MKDLNLFNVFDAIYTTGSVKEAAEKLNVSPPAISHSLGKLRALYNDQLFVREGKGLKKTVFADRLHEKIKDALSTLVNSQSMSLEFDLQNSERDFKIGTEFELDILFYNKLLKNTKSHKNISISKKSDLSNEDDIKTALRLRNVDVIITSTPINEMSYINEEVRREELVAVVRKDHPRIKDNLTIEDFYREEHSGWTGYRENKKILESLIKEDLPERNVVYYTGSNFNSLFMTIEQDWITIATKTFFEMIEPLGNLKSFKLPFESEKLPFYITYHKSFENDEGIKWLIQEIKKSFE